MTRELFIECLNTNRVDLNDFYDWYCSLTEKPINKQDFFKLQRYIPDTALHDYFLTRKAEFEIMSCKSDKTFFYY